MGEFEVRLAKWRRLYDEVEIASEQMESRSGPEREALNRTVIQLKAQADAALDSVNQALAAAKARRITPSPSAHGTRP